MENKIEKILKIFNGTIVTERNKSMAKVDIEVKEGYSGKGNNEFLKLSELSNGDTMTIVTEHRVHNGKFGEQTLVDVNCNGQVYSIALNKTSIMNIVSAYGQDSVNWVGKQLKVQDAHSKKYNKTYKALFSC